MSSDAADVCYTPTGVYELLAKQVHHAFALRGSQLLQQNANDGLRYTSPTGRRGLEDDNETLSDDSGSAAPHARHPSMGQSSRTAGGLDSERSYTLSPGSASASSIKFDFPTRRQSSARLLRPTQSLINYSIGKSRRGSKDGTPAPATSGGSHGTPANVSGGGGAAFMVINSNHSTRGRATKSRAGRSQRRAPSARKKMNEGDMEELFERLYRSASKSKAGMDDDENEDCGASEDSEEKQQQSKKPTAKRPTSAGGMRARVSGKQRFEVLYEYGSIKNLNRRESSHNGHEQYESVVEREALEKHCTFHPKLAPMTRKMMRDGGHGGEDSGADDGVDGFLNRNRQWMLMKERHLREVKSRLDEMVNVDCTFHPKLSSIASLSSGVSRATDDFHYSTGPSSKSRGPRSSEKGRSKSAPRLRPGAAASTLPMASIFSSSAHGTGHAMFASGSDGTGTDSQGSMHREYLVPGLRQHYARMQHAKDLAIERERKLNRCDGTGWTPSPTLSAKAQAGAASHDQKRTVSREDYAPISKLRQSTFGYETNTHIDGYYGSSHI